MGITVYQGPRGPQGVPGPPGPQGPPGDGWAAFSWEQQTASTTWGPIPHNLGFKPSVSVLDGLGREIEPDEVTHIDNNNVLIQLAVADAGTANFS